MPSTVRTDRTDCPRCARRGVTARVILARDAPPLDWERADDGPLPGPWAVFHEMSGAWTARRLRQGERLMPGWHRHAEHVCKEAPA